MKLLDNPRLAAVTAFLTEREASSRVVSGRVEAFSCKRAGDDKKLSKKLDQQYQDELASSPQSASLGRSPLGALSDAATRRLLIDLISTLNASFPDYDFSSLRADQFTKEITEVVARSINRHLADVADSALVDELWAAVDEAVTIRDCEVYSYVPDFDSDPFSEFSGSLWSFNFFFFNKSLKRIVYVTCVARGIEEDDENEFAAAGDDDEYDDDDGDPTYDDDAARLKTGRPGGGAVVGTRLVPGLGAGRALVTALSRREDSSGSRVGETSDPDDALRIRYGRDDDDVDMPGFGAPFDNDDVLD